MLRLTNVTRHYGVTGDRPALDGVSLSIEPGEFVAIEGASGAGKSTLLNILGLLDEPTAGQYEVNGIDMSTLSARDIGALRSDQIGLVFQSFHLLDTRLTIDSVELGLIYRAVPAQERRQLAMRALADVRIDHLAFKPARLLSGGERQRVAVARALATGAPVLLADEPTGNLDSENTRVLLESLVKLHATGTTIVLVTHSDEVASYAARRIVLIDGKVTADSRNVRGDQYADRGDSLQGSEPRRSRSGQGSRLRFGDALKDAWEGVTAKIGRTAGVAAAVAVGVGLAVATLGLSFSAAAQVSDAFDARTNRDVDISWIAGPGSPDADTAASAATQLNGVESVAVIEDLGEVAISATVNRDAQPTKLVVVSGDMSAMRVQTRDGLDASTSLSDGEALVGETLARHINLGPRVAEPVVFVDGQPLRVIGQIESSPRMPELLSSVVVTAWGHERSESPMTLYAFTATGAAQQVAHEAPFAIDPYVPDQFLVTAPPDPHEIRAEIEGQVATMLAIMTTVAIAGGFISLVSAMLLSAGQRTREIGLRRAVGARSPHIAALITIEASLVGMVGALAGLVLGLGAVLTTSALNGWVPVFALWMGPAAVAAGVTMGVLAGILASRRAIRIEPQAALRGA